MFHHLPEAVRQRMAYLEQIDTRDREDGAPKAQRLRQVPPETGRFLALLVASAPPGAVVEIGSSGGYSGLWLALACRERGDRLTTFDVDEDKVRLARQTFAVAGLEQYASVEHADGLEKLGDFEQVAFCFLDAEKELYLPCYQLAAPRLVPGGWFVADNLLSHADALLDFRLAVEADPRLDALVAPIGKGLMLCRRSRNV